LSRQAFERERELNAWVNLLRAHAALTRGLSAGLVNTHGLTINDYEVLLHLWREPEHRLRRVDLADRLLLTASGITRLLDGLERAGYVCKARCDNDARVTYAVLTDAGAAKLEEASATHLREIRKVFGDRFDEDELETLAGLLARLPSDPAACTER
jgi:DNA-binding MarR family transcriptional regulator